jgi:hypothetical protein
MSIKLSVNDCGSISNADPALYVLSYIIKNNYSGANGVSNVKVSAYTSTGNYITASSVKWAGGASASTLVFSQNPWWEIEADFTLNCGTKASCSITSVSITGNWGSIGWAVTFNTAECNISGANGSTVPVYIKGSFTVSNQVTTQAGNYTVTNQFQLTQGWWIEFWGEVLSQLIPNSGLGTTSWNNGSTITGLGILVFDNYNNLEYAYNVKGYNNTGVSSMSIQSVGVSNASNAFLFSMVINAVITPKQFTLGRIIVYMYFNVNTNSSSVLPIGLQGYITGSLTSSSIPWSDNYNALQWSEEVNQPAST